MVAESSRTRRRVRTPGSRPARTAAAGGPAVERDGAGPAAAQRHLTLGADDEDVAFGGPAAYGRPGAPQYVSRSEGPPSTGARCTSGAPSRVEVQATWVPSGEMRGWSTGRLSALTRQARPPSSGASQTSSSAVKAINSPWTWGYRR